MAVGCQITYSYQTHRKLDTLATKCKHFSKLATKVEHVIEDLTGKVDAIIAGGDCNSGIESTVVDMTGKMPIIYVQAGLLRKC